KDAHQQKYQIAYLAQTLDAGRLYRRARGWVESRRSIAEALPVGPVLGRGDAASEQEALQAAAAILKETHERFRGPNLFVTARPETARAAHATGIGVLLVGGADDGADIHRLDGWPSLGGPLLEGK